MTWTNSTMFVRLSAPGLTSVVKQSQIFHYWYLSRINYVLWTFPRAISDHSYTQDSYILITKIQILKEFRLFILHLISAEPKWRPKPYISRQFPWISRLLRSDIFFTSTPRSNVSAPCQHLPSYSQMTKSTINFLQHYPIKRTSCSI